jgi:O-antigen/teichoic acid export membrane protein
MTFRKKIVSAGIWTAGAYGIELTTRLISNVVLTRLLFPEAFGLVAASTSLIVGLTLVSDLGVRALVIQSPHGDQEDFLRSAWVFQASRGLILWSILALVCGLLAIPAVRAVFAPDSVFANPSFPLLTVALGFGLVLGGLESASIALNLRLLNYRSVAVVDLAGKILPVPIMIGLSLLYPSVWVLVAGSFAGGILRVALSHTLVPGPRMALKWSAEHFREIVAFGKWITVSSIASFVGSQSDIILLGFLLPGAGLGVYFIARTLTDAIEGLLERLNATLTLPVLSQVLRDNPDNLRNRYYRFRLPIDVIAAAGAGALVASANDLVALLYDPRYAQAGPMLQLLALGLFLYPIQIIRSAFTAIGRTRSVATVSMIQATSLIGCLLFGFLTFGTLGAVAGIAINRILPSVFMLRLALREGWISVIHELRVVPIFAVGFVVAKAIILVLKAFPWH